MFYGGQFRELDFQILDFKQCRPPNFQLDLRHWSGYIW